MQALAVLIIIAGLDPEPPPSVKVVDIPDDRGGVIEISWTRSLSDTTGNINNVWGYRIFRIQAETFDTQFLGFRDRWSDLVFTDSTAVDGTVYVYCVQTKSSTGVSDPTYSKPVKSSSSFFRTRRLAVALAVIAGVVVFIFSKEKTSDFFKRKAIGDSICWAMEKGKIVMVILSYENPSSRKGVSRTLTDLKWIAEKVISAKGEIRVLTPGYLQSAATGIFREIFMKEGRLQDFNPLWIRRTWSGGVSYSDEATRLISKWKPGIVMITGEPGVWTFQPLNKILSLGGKIVGIKTDLHFLPAVLSSGIGIENISGALSEVFSPGPVNKKYCWAVIFFISVSLGYLLLCWMLMGTDGLEPILSLRNYLPVLKAFP